MNRSTVPLAAVAALFVCACDDPTPPAVDVEGNAVDGPDGTADACATLECGEYGQCAVVAMEAQCVCDPGYDGSACAQCAPRHGRSQDDRCLPVLERSEIEPAGDQCEFGGLAHHSGIDTDGDGVLAATEIQATEYSCADSSTDPCPPDLCGEHGTCVAADSAPSCVCEPGHVGDRCDECAPGTVPRVADGACVEPPPLTELRDEPGSAACPDGSYAVVSGVDRDLNGVLDLDEVVDTSSICKVVREGDVLVTNRAELEALSGVTDIPGSLTITTAYVTDLSPLSSLIHVGGELALVDNGELASLAGFSRLNRVLGGLRIVGNQELTSTAGLSALHTVAGDVRIEGNPLLRTADLGPVGVVDCGLWILSNSELTEVTSTALRSVVGAVVLHENPRLASLSGLGAVSSVGDEIWIEANAALTSLDGLSALEDAGGLALVSNDALEDLAGLSALRTLRGGLSIEFCGALGTLDAFGALKAVDGHVVVRGNEQLSILSGFAALESVGGGVVILEHPALESISGFGALAETRTTDEVPNGTILPPSFEPCAGPFCGGGFGFRPRGSSRGWGAALQVDDNAILSSITGFAVLTRLGAGASISSNPELLAVDGLPVENMEGAFQLNENAKLQSLQLLTTLQTVTGITVRESGMEELVFSGFAFQDNPGPFDPIGPIGRSIDLSVQDNPRLRRLEFSELAGLLVTTIEDNAVLEEVDFGQVRSLGRRTEIVNNARLQRIEGLEQLSGLVEMLTIRDNAALEAVPAMDSIGAESITISGNTNLRRIGGFAGSNYVRQDSRLSIENNPELTTIGDFGSPFESMSFVNLPKLVRLPNVGVPLFGEVERLTLDNLDSITDLSPLVGVERAILRVLRIENNEALRTLAVMGTPSEIQDVSITNNTSLADLDLLKGFTRVFDMDVSGNAQLSSLADLESLTRATTVRMADNPQLPQCEVQALRERVSFSRFEASGNDDAAVCE